VGFQWLLFDFGQRSALVDIAENTSFAANVSFNGMHQKLIYDVMKAYFQYGAALSRVNIAREILRNSQKVLDAAQARRQSGIATTVEVAQAKQQVAQFRLNQVLSQGVERDAWQGLLGAIGISPTYHFTVSYSSDKQLPEISDIPTLSMIKLALSRRPDVLASFAAVQATTSGIRAVEADFLPKVYVAGAVAGGKGRFDVQGLPSVGSQTSSSNILVGISVPLYDGGIRAARVKESESRANAASETFKKTRDIAVREIVASAITLRSAIESNNAALELVSTATITYDSALESYRNGVGTITVVNEAENNLLSARQLSSDAYASARIAAANLAFVMGEITQDPTNAPLR
jgi:outer membrane protein TolC